MVEFIGLFWYNSLLLIHTHTHTHISVYSHVFTSRCLVGASNSGHPPSSGFPNCPRPQLPASHSNSSQQLSPSCSLTNSITNLATHQPTNSTQLICLLIISRHGPHRKYRSTIAVPTIAVETYLFAKPLLSNGCFIGSFRGRCVATGLHAAIFTKNRDILLTGGKWTIVVKMALDEYPEFY
jgi:hypothetical protein